MARADVVVVGSYVQDQAWFVDRFPRIGETLKAHRYNTGPGGKGFNQAVACLRQGVPTAFIGALGNDTFGEYAKKFVAEENMPCRWQVHDDWPTATSSITINPNGENQIALVLGANEHLDVDFVREQNSLFANAKAVLVQLENNLDAVDAALELGERHGPMRVMNPAPVHPQLPEKTFRRAQIVTPNETEFALLLERFAHETVDADSLTTAAPETLHALARKLGVETVVVTLGASGCFVSHGDERHGDIAAFYRIDGERVTAVDSTGAGDAFTGTLVAALTRFAGKSFRDAVVHANRAAAMSTEIVGTAPAMQTYESVVARFGA
ncbi:MAG TPA: ribokinase [Rudaea sp.]|nr:ribokinase [Rudaea sp.]